MTEAHPEGVPSKKRPLKWPTEGRNPLLDYNLIVMIRAGLVDAVGDAEGNLIGFRKTELGGRLSEEGWFERFEKAELEQFDVRA